MKSKINLQEKKIYIGPSEIAGYYNNLTLGLKNHGVNCDFIPLNKHAFGYEEASHIPLLVRFIRFFNSVRLPYFWFIPFKIIFIFLAQVLSACWLICAIFKYDIFIFSFGRSLLRGNLDLPILKFFGKTILSNIGHGSEARPPYLDGSFQNSYGNSYFRNKKMLRYARKIKKKLKFIENYSDIIVGSPASSSQFTKKNQINWFALGIPCQPDYLSERLNFKQEKKKGKNNTIVILHAPSNPLVKGTQKIQKAIESLQDEGFNIDFRLISGRAHTEVLANLEECDLVIDQIYSDTPLAGFGVEAAWFKKATIVSGYSFDEIKQLTPQDCFPPSLLCKPHEIKDVIRDYISNPALMYNSGCAAFDFVSKNWSRNTVAEKWIRLLENEIPNNWWYDPNLTNFVVSAGQNIEVTIRNIKQQLDYFGPASLQVSHNPNLQKLLISLSQQIAETND